MSDVITLPGAAGAPPLQIEYTFTGTPDPTAPLIVFLHEGLGSVSMWRDWPAQLCAAAGARGLVYSRPGYGRSLPRASAAAWDPGYMHAQALEVLPALLAALGIDTRAHPPWLFGHSDGGSIALLYAAHFPAQVAGIVVLAPHFVLEPLAIAGIEAVRAGFAHSGLRDRLARHHDDPDGVFYRWNDAWLHPHFRTWSIEADLDAIRCRVLAIQGVDDEYGTLEQIRGIARHAPQTQLLELAACGHTPFRDQPQAVLQATVEWMKAPPRH